LDLPAISDQRSAINNDCRHKLLASGASRHWENMAKRGEPAFLAGSAESGWNIFFVIRR